MNGKITFDIEFSVDNEWTDAESVVSCLRSMIENRINDEEFKKRLDNFGFYFDGVIDHYEELEYKDGDSRREDYLMNTDSRI